MPFRFPLPPDTVAAGDLAARFVVPADAPYTDGHFEGDPIVPGFIQVGWLLERLGSGRPPARYRLGRFKFVRPVRPGESVELELEPVGEGVYTGRIHAAGELCTSGRIELPPDDV